MSMASLLNHTADLQSTSYSADNSGGLQRTWTTLASSVPVRIEDASASEIQSYGARNIQITHRVFTENAQAQNGYRWLASDGRYYVIKTIPQRRQIGGIGTFYAQMCEEIAPNG